MHASVPQLRGHRANDNVVAILLCSGMTAFRLHRPGRLASFSVYVYAGGIARGNFSYPRLSSVVSGACWSPLCVTGRHDDRTHTLSFLLPKNAGSFWRAPNPSFVWESFNLRVFWPGLAPS